MDPRVRVRTAIAALQQLTLEALIMAPDEDLCELHLELEHWRELANSCQVDRVKRIPAVLLPRWGGELDEVRALLAKIEGGSRATQKN